MYLNLGWPHMTIKCLDQNCYSMIDFLNSRDFENGTFFLIRLCKYMCELIFRHTLANMSHTLFHTPYQGHFELMGLHSC